MTLETVYWHRKISVFRYELVSAQTQDILIVEILCVGLYWKINNNKKNNDKFKIY